MRQSLREADPDRDRTDRAYQRRFFPLVPYWHHFLAGLAGGFVGLMYALVSGQGDYFWSFWLGAFISQLALGVAAEVRRRRG
jgi:hypothetical protein